MKLSYTRMENFQKDSCDQEKIMRLNPKKIGICHYRLGKTDGVSLEIVKRKKMLEQMGYQVKLISGTRQIGADIIIPELEFDRPDIIKIKENAFAGFKLKNNKNDYENEDDLLEDISQIADIIKNKFLLINAREKFDYLFLHNIFTHGRHISAAKSFYDIIKETHTKVISFNHDFYESYEGLYTPRTPKIKAYLKTYVPPPVKDIKHVTINSLSQALLYKKIKHKSILFPDTFEFKQKPWIKDRYNKDLLETFGIKENDLIILQATRIVERKAIELTVDLITALNKRKKELGGKTLYNGKRLDEKFNIVFAFGQYIEPASRVYKQKLIDKMEKQGVKYKFLSDRIEHVRIKKNYRKRICRMRSNSSAGKHSCKVKPRLIKKVKKIYSLWDAYVFADLVSYPSTWEGFGNQFLEAVFAKKPTVVFEYPVFVADIKEEGKGYDYISLGSTFRRVNGLATISQNKLKLAADETIKTLLDPQTPQVLNKNFQIAQEYHGENALEELLRKCLE
jgi:hypothetical protein